MNRYQTASLTVGLALLFVFSPFQANSAHSFEINGVGWVQTAPFGFVGFDLGTPITASWSIVPDGTNLPTVHLATGQSNDPSSLIARLDAIHGGVSPGGADLTQRSWFSLFESSFERWDELSGIDYQYEPNDSGNTFPFGTSGALGVQGDTRIGGHPLDGSGGVLAYAFFPPGGDIVIDTDENRWTNSSDNYLLFRNMAMHEIGHGLGLGHVITGSANFLMDPIFPGSIIDGPQIDEILGVQRLYGDANEQGGGNDTSADATSLGLLSQGAPIAIGTDVSTTDAVTFADVDFLSIDDDTDIDVFSFTVTSSSLVDIQLAPKGPRYQVGPQGGSLQFYDALGQSDLNLELLDSDGTTVLAASDVSGLGNSVTGFAGNEEILGLLLSPGEYFVRVQGGGQDAIQLFQLDLAATAIPEPTSFALLAAAVFCLPCGRRVRRQ